MDQLHPRPGSTDLVEDITDDAGEALRHRVKGNVAARVHVGAIGIVERDLGNKPVKALALAQLFAFPPALGDVLYGPDEGRDLAGDRIRNRPRDVVNPASL